MNKLTKYIAEKVLPDYVRQAYLHEIKIRERETLHNANECDKLLEEMQELESALRESQAECRGLKYAARQKIVIENK